MLTVIKPKVASTSNCLVPKWTSHKLSNAKKYNTQALQQQVIKDKEVILAWDECQKSDFVSMDQFLVSTPGDC